MKTLSDELNLSQPTMNIEASPLDRTCIRYFTWQDVEDASLNCGIWLNPTAYFHDAMYESEEHYQATLRCLRWHRCIIQARAYAMLAPNTHMLARIAQMPPMQT
jgi:hypothetical protein